MKLNQKKPGWALGSVSTCNFVFAIFNVIAVLYFVLHGYSSGSETVAPLHDTHLKLTRDSIKDAVHTLLHSSDSNNPSLPSSSSVAAAGEATSPFFHVESPAKTSAEVEALQERIKELEAAQQRSNIMSSNSNNNNNQNNEANVGKSSAESLEDLICSDPLWCSVPMPSVSHFKFKPPTDPVKWKKAQIAAASGEQVLLKRISKTFTNVYDFLDGDRSFRSLHTIIDIFADTKTGIDALKPDYFLGKTETADSTRRSLLQGVMESHNIASEENAMFEQRRFLADGAKRLPAKDDQEPDEDLEYSSTIYTSAPVTEKPVQVSSLFNKDEMNIESNRYVVPPHYNYRIKLRSPIVQIGYMAFDKNLNTFFSGNHHGGSFMKRNEFMQSWKAAKDKIDVPFITVCALNENWGPISTNFPNRTAGWGNCCQRPQDRGVYEFLDHPKTLMMVINQHSNLSHPKILTIPRGLPLTWMWTRQVAFDSIKYAVDNIKKERLLFASASSWGKRPQMIHCVSNKFDPTDFEGHDATPKTEMLKTKLDRRRYYHKLASAKFGLSLPGLGYDTFRMWELLTLGSIVVIERGIGFDRTLWRLPALLVDDFDDVTPELLHSAYVEALYRADDFEFNRLKQSFWWDVIYNVSVSMSIEPLLHFFPMEAEDTGFTRPKDPYECGRHNPHKCGPGTKRIPKSSC